MDIENKLDALKQIKQVDAPPFLFTRIKQQIHALNTVEAPLQWKWTFGVASVVILLLNIASLLNTPESTPSKQTGIENIVTSMDLATSNTLYNE
jgi:hypothetical protein